jgi:hypothetical protein
MYHRRDKKRKFRKDTHGDCSIKKRRVVANRTIVEALSGQREKKITQTPTSPQRVEEQATIAADKLDKRPEGRFGTTY